MMTNEMFPPTQEELEKVIDTLQKQLEDERYRDEWQELHEELKEKERQLEELKNKDNV